jgi:hypothetical protein
VSETSPFAVILSRPEEREPMALAKALAAIRKTPVQDQVAAAKRGWGILAENLSAEEAQSLVEGLGRLGLECASLPTSSLVPLPETKPIGRFEPALTDRLVLVAAAGITVTSTTTKAVKEGPSAAQKALSTAILLGTGLPIKIGGKERTVEKTQTQSDRVFYLDLLYKDPFRRLRVDALHFDYSFLKERKLYQVFGNFKLLLGDLAQAVPGAWRNHGTKILLSGSPLQKMGYESLADLERETRWLLTLQTL